MFHILFVQDPSDYHLGQYNVVKQKGIVGMNISERIPAAGILSLMYVVSFNHLGVA